MRKSYGIMPQALGIANEGIRTQRAVKPPSAVVRAITLPLLSKASIVQT
jgi:hypothetical protein